MCVLRYSAVRPGSIRQNCKLHSFLEKKEEEKNSCRPDLLLKVLQISRDARLLAHQTNSNWCH